MAKPKRDKTICRYCNLSEPLVEIQLSNGKPEGYCKSCYNYRYKDRLVAKAQTRGLFNNSQASNNHNASALRSLQAPNAYPLTYLNTRKRVGFIVLLPDAYYVSLWSDRHIGRYAINQYGMALWLANQGVIIGSTELPIQDPLGQPVALETLGAELPLKDVCDYLIMFDVKLNEYAIRKVREELGLLKGAVVDAGGKVVASSGKRVGKKKAAKKRKT